jgi:hypothetical protein
MAFMDDKEGAYEVINGRESTRCGIGLLDDVDDIASTEDDCRMLIESGGKCPLLSKLRVPGLCTISDQLIDVNEVEKATYKTFVLMTE